MSFDVILELTSDNRNVLEKINHEMTFKFFLAKKKLLTHGPWKHKFTAFTYYSITYV